MGYNYYGELGDGTATDRSTPVQTSGLTSGVTAIAGGYDHSLAIRGDGTVWAWGFNNHGQLGDGTTTNRATPVPVCFASPGFTTQPANQTVCTGGLASFSVIAAGNPAPTYQWRRGASELTDGGNISGATTATLIINPAGAGDAASNYNCIIASACGSATSNAATLTIYSSGSGDGNFDALVDGQDIQGFIDAMLSGGGVGASYCAYDMNHSGTVTVDDIALIVGAIIGP